MNVIGMFGAARRCIGTASRHGRNVAAVLAIGGLVPAVAIAQSAPGPWQYSASIYAYLPSVGGSTSFPADSGGTPINVDADKILDRLKFAAMGTFDANNGTWGVFTDVVYLHFGASKSNSRDFTIGNNLPAGTTANFDSNLEGWLWTLAGEYRLLSDPAWTVDLLAGTRLLDMHERLNWSISGSIGPLDPVARSSSADVKASVWDAIIGVKGRYSFGANRAWALPFYLDVGTGGSASTVQAAAGVSYAFKWVEAIAMWRYLGYHAKSGEAIKELSFNGPLIGAVFRW
jgi:hypothetical protein